MKKEMTIAFGGFNQTVDESITMPKILGYGTLTFLANDIDIVTNKDCPIHIEGFHLIGYEPFGKFKKWRFYQRLKKCYILYKWLKKYSA